MIPNITLSPYGVKQGQSTVHWVSFYTGAVTTIGVGITLLAFTHPTSDWPGLFLFMIAAGLAELTSVELFANSRSRISVSTIFAIAAIILFGPPAGVLTHLASSTVTLVTTSLFQHQLPQKGQRASALQRFAFNTSMGGVAVFLGGWVYVWFGGLPGDVTRLTNIVPLILAVTIDTLINIALLMGVIGLQTGRPLLHMWRQDFQWGVPIAVVGAIIGGGGLALGYNLFGNLGLAVFMLPVIATGYAFRLYVNNSRGYVNQLEEMNRRLENANLGLLQTLAAVIDAYDIYTYGHSTQVARYGYAIAQKMCLPLEQQTKILHGGLIHDVGKIGIKETIISKPGKLTDEEYEALKRHTVIGAEIISHMSGLQELIPLVRNHHERWDGRGYPDGLKGDETPLDARILAVADSVEAMLSDRPYRPMRSLTDVVEEVKRCAGKQFDPTVVTAFLAVVEEQGSAFFMNSAVRIDTTLQNQHMAEAAIDHKYLKKSTLNFTTALPVEFFPPSRGE